MSQATSTPCPSAPLGPTRIAAVSKLPISTLGGMQHFARWLNGVLRAAGHEVFEISPPLTALQRRPGYYAALGEPQQIWRVSRACARRRGDYDLAIVHSPAGFVPGPGLNVFHLNPYEYARRAYSRWHPNHWRLRWMNQNYERISARGPRANIALCRHQAASLESLGIAVDRIVPIPVDAGLFRPPGDRAALRAELGWPVEPFTVFAAARPSRGKGWDRVLRLAARFPEVRFVLAGPARLDAAAPSNCVALGLAPWDAMPRYYQAADLFLSFSLCEGFLLTLLEAMSTGLPFLVTPTGFAWDLKDEGGPLAEGVIDFDEAGDADALRRAIDSPALREELGGAGRAFAIDKANPDKIAAAYLEMIEIARAG